MYLLRDTFSDSTISRHHTIEAAVRADRAHARMIRRANGNSSYIPTSITHADGKPLTADEAHDAERVRWTA